MGVVIRQGLKTSAINFLGVLVAILSTLFVYSHPSNLEISGFASTLYVISSFLAAFVGNGVGYAGIKFFEQFKKGSETYPSGFLMFLLFLLFGLLSIFLMIVILCKSFFYSILNNLHFDATIFKNYEILIALMLIMISFITLISSYGSNFGRIAFPSMILNFGYKLWLPVIILLAQFEFIDVNTFHCLIPVFFILAFFLIFLYLYQNKFFDFNYQFSAYFPHIKSILPFAIISSLTGLGSLIAFRVDTVMISGILGLKETGIYVLAMTIPAVLDIPNQALLGITGPLIAKHWTQNDSKQIGLLYKKGSLNLLLIGLLIALGGYYCYDDLAKISGNADSFQLGKNTFIILCLAKLIDMVTSVNGVIISYSKKYHINLFFIFFLACSNILLNYYLIPIYGILGAAIATLIAITLFNIFKSIYIFVTFGIHPFCKETFITLLIGTVTFIIAFFLPEINFSFLNILFKAIVISSIYVFLIYKLKISSEANGILENYLPIIRNFK